MSSETLGVILFFLIGFAWVMYLVQEVFLSGTALFNKILPRNHSERKQLQVISGLHFDGMLVWFIAAETMLFGVFPLAYAMQFTYLYIPLYLLLFALIARGISIELLYKVDDKRWQTGNTVAWLVSSVLLLFIFGVYITHIFYGFPIRTDGLYGSFLAIFNVATIGGGLFFVVLGFVSGAAWIKFMTSGDIGDRAMSFIKKVGLPIMAPVIFLLIVMGLNNSHTSIFTGQLFGDYPIFFALPALTIIAGLLIILFGYKAKAKELFISALAMMSFYIVMGFVGIFPYILPSHIERNLGISIEDAFSGVKGTTVIFIAVVIFFPIVIGYQVWKYIHFKEKS